MAPVTRGFESCTDEPAVSGAAHADAAASCARIGPNAITQVAAALEAVVGPQRATRVFEAAGLSRHRAVPPAAMVPESEVTALHRALRESLAADERAAVCREAGELTGAYLLAHRIPRPVQALLRVLPAAVASRMLLAAIARHAWTFAGSGRFAVARGDPLVLSIEGCALCRGAATERPDCGYYAATFERLFRTLVSPGSRVREVACEACGAPACRFEVRW